MKQKFSLSWRASRQKRKQRKFRMQAPLHIRHKLISSGLSKELRKSYGRRSFSLRKGDSVKVLVGKFKGKKGKINNVSLKKLKVTIEGLQIQKKDGTKINVWFQPSNLQIEALNLDDKKRSQAIKNIVKEVKEEKSEEKKENAPKKN